MFRIFFCRERREADQRDRDRVEKQRLAEKERREREQRELERREVERREREQRKIDDDVNKHFKLSMELAQKVNLYYLFKQLP